jgi:2-polyprenyl-3-methyl-5-hydroxy-6-metoxy-1,4-benzoquinol methylase
MNEMFWRFKYHTFPSYRSILQKTLFKEDGPCLILDAGCGQYGSIEEPLHTNWKVIGTDIDTRLVAKAKGGSVRIEDYAVASLTYLPFRENVFDIVLCQDVLEHVEEKRISIQKIAKVTKKGGKFLGSTTNLLNPLMLFDTLAPKFITHTLVQKYSEVEYFQRHIRLTPLNLRCFLEENFQEVKIQLTSAPPFESLKYHNKENLPWFVKIWILFDKLTSHCFLKTFKEMMLFEAVK